MGKKGYNWKSRAFVNVEIDNSTTKEIILDIEHHAEHYDNCNALVLPTQKRKTKNIDKKVSTTRLLSKKRKKQLEKVVERKKKKLQRATLLEDLAKVQASPVELQQYMSLLSLQNKGLKRHFQELNTPIEKLKRKADDEGKSDEDLIKTTINSIKMSKKKRLVLLNSVKQDKAKLNPNVIGFESSDSSYECDSDNKEKNETHVLDNTTASNIVASERTKTSEKESEKNHIKDAERETTLIKSQESKKSVEQVQRNVVAKVHTPAVFISVNRKPEIQAARLKLPIVGEEQIIVETINENPIVIITGETGSGKTTQLPQFLYEAGYAQNKLIGITEPRRVAAMSMSKRVVEELNLSEKEVSYLIRFEGNVTEETKIKFMTDGVLLKEIQSDFLLTKYSVIILDEAHERSVHTDILIGLLSRIVPLRNKHGDPLKLIIMSATLSVKEFIENAKLFKTKPPVIEVKARQFFVKIHFNKKTSKDYVNEALRKAIKIHTRLPEGGILIFLTGQQEVHTVVRKLRKLFPLKRNKHPQVKVVENFEKNETSETSDKEHSEKNDSDDDFDTKEALRRNKRRQRKQIILPTINLDDYSVNPTDDTHEDLINVQDDKDNLDEDEDEDEDVYDFKGLTNAQPLWVLPLYSLLPGRKQAKVFEPPPDGYRLCVVSTNIAETSLTIPNIRYVVDSGRCKIRIYDKVTGVSMYHISYVSKAAATQRAGRAGRTLPGHCYRLYSSAVYNNDFEEYSQSEIQRKPVNDLLLQMKAMSIDKVVNFPFPTPPNIVQLKSAEKRLIILGALQPPLKKQEETYCAKITSLGRSIAAFPVSPRYGKMLALSHQHNLSKYTICMVAALSVQEVLIEALDGSVKSKWLQKRRYWAGSDNNLLLGDPMVLIRAIGTAEYAGSKGRLLPFCEENGLRHKAVVEIRKLRQQLTNEINLNVPNLNLIIDPKMPLPTDMEAKLLRQIVLAGMTDQIARKVLPDEVKEDQNKAKWKYAYRTLDMEEPVFMHSSCVLRKTSPELVVYQEVYETNKMYMRGVTAIEPEWLPKFAPTLCHLSEPLVDPPPRYNQETGKIICRVSGTFGKAGWALPSIDMEHPLTIDGVKWFAYFFLEGQVCLKLKQFVPLLLTTPGSITKSWAKLIPRIQAIIQTLQSQGVISKDKLVEIWESDKKFLLSAYQKWLPESAHVKVAQLWPPL